jgi:hypothetical protein
MKKRKCGEMLSRDKKKKRIVCSKVNLPITEIEWSFHGVEEKMVGSEGTKVLVNEKEFCRALSGIFYRLCGESAAYCEGRGDLPSVTEIQTFITQVFLESEMEYCCGVIGLIYVVRADLNHRLGSYANDKPFIDECNWRSILLSSLVLASKVYDDGCMTNEDFADIFSCTSQEHAQGSGLTLARLNWLEIELLQSIDHHMWVEAEEYNTYANMVHAELQLVRCMSGDEVSPRSRALEAAGGRGLAVVSDCEDEDGVGGATSLSGEGEGGAETRSRSRSGGGSSVSIEEDSKTHSSPQVVVDRIEAAQQEQKILWPFSLLFTPFSSF